MKKFCSNLIFTVAALSVCLTLCACGQISSSASDGYSPAPTSGTAPTPGSPAAYELLGKKYGADTEYVDLRGITPGDIPEVLETLSQLSALKTIDLGDDESCNLAWSTIERLHNASPQAVINYSFKLYGKDCDLSRDTLDLKYRKISDRGTLVRTVAGCMTNLAVLDMDSCGISNEDMAAIRDDFPDVDVIWRISFGDKYSVRTNVTRILASAPDLGGELIHDNLDNLKYCTKVKYLDLGHNNFMDTLEFIRYMPELEVGIFAMSNIEDFSPLADCPKLEYLEIQTSRLHDLTPLSGLENLRHLNICYCFAINDITPLYSLTKLERLWIGSYDPVPPEQIERMRELAPDCVINTTTTDPTAEGWRMGGPDPDGYPTYDERYALLRKQFGYQDYDYALYWCDPLYFYGW